MAGSTRYDPRQDILGDAFDPEDTSGFDYLSYQSLCLIAVIPFKNPATYSRIAGASGSSDPNDAVDTSDPILIDTDVLNCNVQQSKDSCVGAMNATLMFSDVEYLNTVFPNDWIFAWIVYNPELKEDLKQRILQKEPVNKFSDGLKFVGRVSSIRKAFVQDPSGMKRVTYTLQGNSFKELDSIVFYDPYYQQKVSGVSDFISRISQGVNKLLTTTGSNGAFITTYTAFTTFIDLIVGAGIPKDAFSPGIANAIPTTQSPTLPEEAGAPYAYCVPATVGQLLNKQSVSKSGGVLSYADILELLIGIQTYSTQLNGKMTFDVAGRAFAPDGIPQQQNIQTRYTNIPLLGTFEPDSPRFDNRPLWSLLDQYINPVVNEKFCTLRVNPAGYVEPTMVVRQFPFSSELSSNPVTTGTSTNFTDLQTIIDNNTGGASSTPTPLNPAPDHNNQTTFLSVPRWIITPGMVMGADLGRSDAQHINFTHVYGDATQKFPGDAAQVAARLINPPKIDQLDIKRSGIRMYPTQTVNCSGEDVLNGAAGVWMSLVADWTMDLHLTLNGTINCIGIQAPIAVGDNLEYDGAVLHIEEVSHQWSVTGGHTHFVTSLSVAHGLRDNPLDTIANNSSERFRDKFLYMGTNEGDLTDLDPGLTKVNWDSDKNNPGSSF